jgi:glycosyltransferase involved in cell wall biosynthesis
MLSIIVPTHQRRDLVLRLLKALAQQDLPAGPVEVIVVADGCSDGTVEAVTSLSIPFPLQVLEQSHGGQAAARNHGAARARGDGLLFLDDDVVLERDFLGRLLGSLDRGTDVVLSAVRVGDWVPDTLITREQRYWHSQVETAIQAGAPSFHDVHFVATWVRRACFEELGGFDVSFTNEGMWGGEDSELAYRMIKRDCKIVCKPDITVTIDCVTDPRIVLRRGYDSGRNDVRLAKCYPDLTPDLFGSALEQARIRSWVGYIVLSAPFVVALRWPLRAVVTNAIAGGLKGTLLYRLWLITLGLEWWRGVIDAGGRELARSEMGS